MNRFENKLTNIGGIETDDLGILLSYLSPNTDFGRLQLTWLNLAPINYTERIPTEAGFEEIERIGREIGDPPQAYPRYKFTLSLGWGFDEVGVLLTSRYVHSVTEACRGLSDFPDTCSDPNMEDDELSENELNPRLYLDAQVSWLPTVLDERLTITLGVNNILNQAPPPCYSCALNGFDQTTYDVPGVFGYLRAGYRFSD